MTSYRKAIRFFSVVLSLGLPIAASAATFDVKTLIDTDNNRSTGCSVVTPGGIVNGIDVIVTTQGTVTGATGTITAVTRQACVNAVLNQFSSATAVDGGWNVGVSPIGDVTVESHMGLDVLTQDNIGTPRFVFISTSGLSSDVLLTPWSWGGGDIVMPHAARDRAVSPMPPRNIVLDGGSTDWAGNVPLANGTAAAPIWRFITASAYAGLHDLFFNFQIHTNPAAPTAHDDNYALSTLGGTLTVATTGVLNNDNPNNQPITASLVDTTQHGMLALAPNGGFTYIHDGSLASQDQFHYVAVGTALSSNVATVTIDLPGTHPYTFTSANNVTFIDGQPNTFQVVVTGKPTPALSVDGALPAGVTFQDLGNGTGTLSGTPAPNTSGDYNLVFQAEKNKPHGSSQPFTLTVTCPGVAVQNPAVTTGTAGTPFSQTFVQTGGTAPVSFALNTGTLPPGLTLSSAGVLSGTPTGSGTFPITVKVTDVGGCTGVGPTYNLIIACHPITVTNPVTTTGTATVAFSQTFTQSGAVGGAAFALNSGTLPAGLTLSGAGVLSGTPTQTGSFPITVKVTDGQGCTGVSPTYTLTIGCQAITVTNPATNTGTAAAAFSQTFTAGNTIGAVTFSTASTLPAGLTLSGAGVLSGTPMQTGSFPIVVKATDANGCFGNGATYTLTISCQTITVNNPATNAGTVNIAFSQTFTAPAAIGTTTFTLNSGSLPAGITLSTAGVLSGTPTQTGSFPITVKATDANGCFGIGATYTLTIGCQTVTVTNPATNSGTVSSAFSQSFTSGNAIAPVTFTLNSGTLPAGITLSAAGVLSGTPTQNGSFPITVKATDANGCFGIGATYTLTINCQTITVTNPATTTGTAGTAFSQTFTQAGGIGATTFALFSGTLPAGMTFHSATGVLDGTPTQIGSFPLVIQATDANGCTGTGSTYTLVIGCQTLTVTNPATTTGTAGTAFSQTFTQTGGIGTTTFALFSGTLPAGMTFHSATGVLDGTPTQTGSFPLVIQATDSNGCTGDGATYTLVIGCQTITVTNPATTTGTAGTPFSQNFSQSGAIGGATFSLNSGSLPAGLTLSASGLLSGTPLQTGSFMITVKVTDGNGCTGISATYTLAIGCQTITVTNPATSTGTIQVAFSQTFTQSGAIGGATFSLNSGSLPAGLTLSSAGLVSGTPTVTGSFPITVLVTDGNGCTGVSATYNLVINCQTITVTNPATTTGTVSTPFTQTFTQTGANGTATFTTASTLPAGLTLAANGTLSGTPAQSGPFSIVVTVTDSNGCTGTGATYNLIISCQTITVGNPATTSSPAGTPLSINFTQTGAIGTATFTTASTLPPGLILDTDGTLHGTPSGSNSFPIVVTVTDSNGCTGTNPAYTLTITCPAITVTNPATNTGTAGVAFTATFTQSGGQGTIAWSETGALPAGITLNSVTGVLSGTTSAAGSFPITVTATDQNSCTGTGTTYTLTIDCQTITITNPAVNTGTVDAAFSQTFMVAGILGTVTWSETGALPAGITLNPATGVLSGTPTEKGSFPIVVKATDTNACFNTSSYTLTINCQTITVTNPGVNTGTVDAPFSQTFTQTGAHGTATFTTGSALPTGLSLSTGGVLSGTPTVKGTFPIVVTVTDSNSCTGSGSTYTLIIGCQTITVTNPATNTGTAGTPFSQTFTQSGAHATATFTTASTLPTGFSLSTAGVLSGTTSQHGTFPIVVTVTDANICTGTSATYNLNIACNVITVTNPATATGTVATAFSQTFTSSGILGTASYTTASTLPTGLTLHSATGILDGTPTQSGSFPIVVTATDSNGCTGTGATYTLVIGCNVITVTNPIVNSGTAGTPFSQTFTQSGGNGTIVWSETGALPAGITINTSTGALFGTTSQTGSFPITVTATDGNGCAGTGPTYTLTINCQTITVTNPATNTTQAGVAFDQAFTATGILGTATWSETGALPSGITLNTSTGHLAGTTTQIGSFPITVTVMDTNGCSGTGATYTLTVTCPTITVTRNGGGSFPAGIFNSAYTGQSVTATPASTYTFAVTSGSLPTGLSLSSAGAISGTPTATGNFTFTVTATDTNSLCTGSQSFSIAIAPVATGDTYGAPSHIIDNTQFVITGGTTTSPATPFVGSATTLIANDLPPGGVVATAGTFATSAGGSVTIAADGTFIYTPKANSAGAAITSDSFTYTVVSNGVTSAAGTVNLSLANRVWYVKNNGAAGDGRSHLPFNTLAAAQTAALAFDIIYVYNGDGTTTGQTAGITLKANQQLIGEGVALVVNTVTLKPAGTKPIITNTAPTSDGITLNSGNTVKGLTVSAATQHGISGSGFGGFTGDTLLLTNSANADLILTNFSGASALTNSQITNSGVGGGGGVGALSILGGTGSVTVDGTNTITVNSGRSVVIQSRTAGAGITIGAAINDSGGGIDIATNSGAETFAFTGAQTLTTTTNPALTITGNTAGVINFSGTLNITTTTGKGFDANAGNAAATINVTGTANVTTGATANGVNINGVTVGASGITFNSVNTTGATTGVTVSPLTGSGTVTINGGTINGGTTGILLGSTFAKLSLDSVTVNGSPTTAISSSGFNTLTIGSSVNVSGVTALSLSTGNLNGTFANLSSTGGTNGVVLTSIGGTGWTATAGSLTGASGAAFKVDGGNANMTYGGSITSTGFLADIGATTGRSGGTITLSGALGGAGTLAGTGIRVQNSTASSVFTFSGTQTLGTSGSRMAATAVTLTANAANTTFNFNGTLSIFTTGATAFTANGGGTINFSGTDAIDAATGQALVLNGMALGAGTLTGVTSTGGVNGIALTTVTSGPLTISGGSLSGNSGSAFLINGGTASVSYAGSITQNTAGQRAVDIQNTTGGTKTLSGSIGSSGGAGVFLNSNTGAIINISGNMTLSTGGTVAFTATGGGTVNATGTNNITTTSGTGINWNGVTGVSTETFNNVTSSSGGAVSITSSGATDFTMNDVTSTTGTAVAITTATGDFTFHAINANGAGTGVNVNAATSSFTVNGTGTTAGSGGTIQNCNNGMKFVSATGITLKNMNLATNGNGQTVTGASTQCGGDLLGGNNLSCVANLFLQNTVNVSLDRLSVTNSNQIGINGNGVNGLSITNCTITGNGNESEEHGVLLQNTSGTLTANNDVIRDNEARQMYVAQNGAQTLVFNTTSTNYDRTVDGTASTGQGLLLDLIGTSSTTFTGTSLTFAHAQGLTQANAFQINLNGSATMPASSISNSSFDLQAAAIDVTSGSNGAATFNSINNTIDHSSIQSILYGFLGAAGSGSLTGTIQLNKIGQTQGCITAASACAGISINSGNGWFGQMHLLVDNNTIQRVSGGLLVTIDGSASSAPTAHIKMTRNTINTPTGGAADAALRVTAATTSGNPNLNGCWDVGGAALQNTIAGDWGVGGATTSIQFRQRFSGNGSWILPGYGGASGDSAAVTTYVDGRNSITPPSGGFTKVLVTNTTTPFAGGVCVTP